MPTRAFEVIDDLSSIHGGRRWQDPGFDPPPALPKGWPWPLPPTGPTFPPPLPDPPGMPRHPGPSFPSLPGDPGLERGT